MLGGQHGSVLLPSGRMAPLPTLPVLADGEEDRQARLAALEWLGGGLRSASLGCLSVPGGSALATCRDAGQHSVYPSWLLSFPLPDSRNSAVYLLLGRLPLPGSPPQSLKWPEAVSVAVCLSLSVRVCPCLCLCCLRLTTHPLDFSFLRGVGGVGHRATTPLPHSKSPQRSK